MSFMFNPHPYDDPTAVNRPKLDEGTVRSILSGTKETAGYISDLLIEKLKNNIGPVVLALDGYIGAQFGQMINLLSQNLRQKSIQVTALHFADVYKSSAQLDAEFTENLKEDREKDPVLLFGKLFKENYEDLLDKEKLARLENELKDTKAGENHNVIIVYGNGCTIKRLRPLYDLVLYFDVTPKEVILRAKKGMFTNLGDPIAKPVKSLLRRCYYVDFEVAGHLRWDLIKSDAINFYVVSNDPDHLYLLPRESFSAITSALAKYPFRCKPVYLEGVWGGHYIRKLRNLPDSMVNCAWVFDLIPLEVSIVVEAGKHQLEFPFFTFVQKEGTALMGADCVKKFGGYFPTRFNYDDSYHSSGNMSIQVHSGHDY